VKGLKLGGAAVGAICGIGDDRELRASTRGEASACARSLAMVSSASCKRFAMAMTCDKGGTLS
jgi:hypothetical protein